MGYDPSVETPESGAWVQRVSLAEAALFANRLSDNAGLARCYRVSCADSAPQSDAESDPEASLLPRFAHAAPCPGDANWCLDARRCAVSTVRDPCGYRLPTVSEWMGLVAANPDGLEVGVVAELTSPSADTVGADDILSVVGMSWLTSSAADAQREAPTRAALKSFNVGFRLAR